MYTNLLEARSGETEETKQKQFEMLFPIGPQGVMI